MYKNLDKKKGISEDLQKIIEMQVKKDGLKEMTKKDAEAIAGFYGKDISLEMLDKDTAFVKKHFGDELAVAKILSDENKSRLYRLRYSTFEEYVRVEFDVTRGRAYQQISAYGLAKFINEKIGSDVITNESQARELQNLRVYDGAKENASETSKARIDLVKSILDSKRGISSKSIADEVSKIMLKVKEDKLSKMTVEEYVKGLNLSSVQDRIKAKLETCSDEEKAELKNEAIKELEVLIETLKNS